MTKVTCPFCGATAEVDADLMVGQHVLCPYCEKKFVYGEGNAADDISAGDQHQPLISVSCPHCGTEYEVEQSECGITAICQTCNKEFVVGQSEMRESVAEKAPDIGEGTFKFCAKCGAKMSADARFCPICGRDAAGGPGSSLGEDVVSSVLPPDGKHRSEQVPFHSLISKVKGRVPLLIASCTLLVILLVGIVCAFAFGDATKAALKAFKSNPPQWERGFRLAQKADINNPELQYYIGECFAFGYGVAKDIDEAVQWYQKSANQGNADAHYAWGLMRYRNAKGEMGQALAAGTIRMAAEQGHVKAQCWLGHWYNSCSKSSREKAEELRKSAEWFRKAAEQNNAEAQFNLSLCYADGKGVAKDLHEAIKWCREAASRGYAPAQNQLGICYLNGDGVNKDPHEAVNWIRKAAEQNYADAQCQLGICYMNGDGVDSNMREGEIWLRKAAEQDNAEAQYKLGEHIELVTGSYTSQEDKIEIANWYRKAAEQGLAKAQYQLAHCYQSRYVPDVGEQERKTKFAYWMRKAAEQGYPQAQLALGTCYINGTGVNQDRDEGFRWYVMAAEHGYAFAQYLVGKCYAEGQDVKKNKSEAIKWYRKAAASKDDPGAAHLAQEGLEALLK